MQDMISQIRTKSTFTSYQLEGVSGFFGKLGGVDFETGGFEVEGILNHLTGGVGEAGRKLKIRQSGLSGEVFSQQGHINGVL